MHFLGPATAAMSTFNYNKQATSNVIFVASENHQKSGGRQIRVPAQNESRTSLHTASLVNIGASPNMVYVFVMND